MMMMIMMMMMISRYPYQLTNKLWSISYTTPESMIMLRTLYVRFHNACYVTTPTAPIRPVALAVICGTSYGCHNILLLPT